MSSQYAKVVPSILAEMEQERKLDDGQCPPDEIPPDEHGEPEKQTMYVYRTDTGGVLITPTRIEGDEDEPQAPIIDAEESALAAKAPPLFLVFVLLLCLFVVLDVADNQLIALLTPTATITITPQVKTVTLHSTAALGKMLSPLTISQSQTIPTTGHGHQDATRATGSLTFYNGSYVSQTINAGTVYTGQSGIQVALSQTVTIPAAQPPQFGEAPATAQALNAGAAGNIQADDITLALSNFLTVKNLAAFTGGRDARDFQIVTRTDRDTAAAALKAKVTSSMTAALQGQILPGEELQRSPCNPTIALDHQVGEEAHTVQVTVSETCTAIAYDVNTLQVRATQLLTSQAVSKLETGYTLYGNATVTVTKADTTPTKAVVLSFTAQATYLFQFNAKQQQSIKTLIAGKPRPEALHVLSLLSGIHHVSITGISDNQLIPDDPADIHLLVVYAVF